jgi:REP element-mobilizing transposase RayT
MTKFVPETVKARVPRSTLEWLLWLMNLSEGGLYHVFNRGNNREVIFPRQSNYHHFLESVQKCLLKYCDLLAWCLMPNHFHFLVHGNEHSVPLIFDGSFERQQFSQGIKQLLSSYAKAINKQQGRTGSLFQQKTKCIHVSDPVQEYSLTAFHYIHQNPVRAGLVDRMEDWEFSSFREYMGTTKTSLCNRELGARLLDLDLDRFYEDSYSVQELSYTCQV